MAVWRDKTTGGWRIEIQCRGRPVHRRLPSSASQSDARLLESQLRIECRQARQPVAKTLTDAMALHEAELRAKKSYDSARYHLYRIAPWVDGKPLDEAPAVAQAIVADLAGHYANATINRSLAALKRACTLAWRARWTPTDLNRMIELLPERNERHNYGDEREIAAICEHDPSIADAVMILAYSGLRLGEFLSLTPRSVRGESIVTTADTKTGRARSVPIAAPIREHVQRLPFPMARRTLQTRFKAAATAIGRPDMHLHDLRHSTASLLAQAGVSLQVIGAILGHSSPQTTARYAHLVEDNKREAMAKLGGSPATKSRQSRRKSAA